MDVRADDGADAEPGSRWLTHRQLADIRGISTASAIKLALRHGWRKQKDNRGLVRCLVPPEWTSSKRDMQAADLSADERAAVGADTGADKSSEISLLRSVYETALEATTARVDALIGQIEALKGEVAVQAALIEGFKGQREGLLAADARADRAEASVAGERARADAPAGAERAGRACLYHPVKPRHLAVPGEPEPGRQQLTEIRYARDVAQRGRRLPAFRVSVSLSNLAPDPIWGFFLAERSRSGMAAAADMRYM